jgi:NOL1/NOP2/fmu family ribosome biogenesis protein
MYFNVIEKLHSDDRHWLELNSQEAHSTFCVETVESNEIQGNNDIQLKWNYNMLLPKYQYNFKRT